MVHNKLIAYLDILEVALGMPWSAYNVTSCCEFFILID